VAGTGCIPVSSVLLRKTGIADQGNSSRQSSEPLAKNAQESGNAFFTNAPVDCWLSLP
jgi:hypothetical protein